MATIATTSIQDNFLISVSGSVYKPTTFNSVSSLGTDTVLNTPISITSTIHSPILYNVLSSWPTKETGTTDFTNLTRNPILPGSVSSTGSDIVLNTPTPTVNSLGYVVPIEEIGFRTYSMFSGGSLYLTGTSGIYVQDPSSLYNLTSNTTIEFWMRPTCLPNSGTVIGLLSKRPDTGISPANWLTLAITDSGLLQLQVSSTSVTPGWGLTATGTKAISVGTWYHVALTKSSGTWTVYLNGKQYIVGTMANTVRDTASTLAIGAYASNGSNAFSGYISGFRYVSGTVVYTSDFTTPNLAPTSYNPPNGDANPSAVFFPQNILASISFNGTSQYLSKDDTNRNLDLTQVPNWTVECWFRMNSTTGNQTVFARDGWTLHSNSSLYFYINNGTGTWGMGNGGGGAVANYSIPTNFSANTWYHFALVRSGGSITSYVNGVASPTQTLIGNPVPDYLGSPYFNIGNASDGSTSLFNGYISNFRIVKGVAVYSGSFTPSTVPLEDIQQANIYGSPSAAITAGSTVLLLSTVNTSSFLADSSPFNNTMTNNGSITRSTLTPFNSNILGSPGCVLLLNPKYGNTTITDTTNTEFPSGITTYNPIITGTYTISALSPNETIYSTKVNQNITPGTNSVVGYSFYGLGGAATVASSTIELWI